MAKITIYDVSLDPANHKGNPPEAIAGVFAHLKDEEKADAVAQLNDAINQLPLTKEEKQAQKDAIASGDAVPTS